MKGQPVDDLVYERIFPFPKTADPQNFQVFLQRNLIPEVRQETHAFYGHLDTQEAKFPGLDYTHQTHRLRLSRWPCHRRLFRAFDTLRLTKAEISSLTKWEGTKWAKEKYEKEQGIVIRDTTADEVSDWEPPSGSQRPHRRHNDEPVVERERSLPRLFNGGELNGMIPARSDAYRPESDDEFESVGVDLNQRLRDRATRREAGDTSVVLDEEWEQWLKNAIESGELTYLTAQMTEQLLRRASTTRTIPAALVPPGMLSAARSGHWSEVPQALQPMLRRTLDSQSSASSSEIRRTMGTRRLPSTGDIQRQLESATRSTLPRVEIRLPRAQVPHAQGAF